MNVLLISFSYAPMLSTQAFRWTPIAEELVRRGHGVSVVSGWQPGTERQEGRSGLDVHRVGGTVTERFRSLYNDRRAQGRSKPPNVCLANKFEGVSVDMFKRMHDVSWKRIYWPDAHCTWSLPAIQRARNILQSRNIDALITVALPFTSHVVGLALKAESAALRWLCDMSDPFSYLEPTPPNNVRLYRRLNSWIERRVFQRADSVAVTCSDTLRRYSEIYPQWKAKLAVVPHLLSADSAKTLVGTCSLPARGEGRGRSLVFAGILDGRIRDPRPLLDACRRIVERGLVPGLQLHLYGPIGDCGEVFGEYSRFRDRWLFLHGLVDKQAADKAVAAADVLVNIGNKYQCQLPSKLVEYGSTGKPILNVVGCSSDLSMEALKGYKAALHLVCAGGTMADSQIEEMERFVKFQEPLADEETHAWIRQFKLPAIVKQYEDLIG